MNRPWDELIEHHFSVPYHEADAFADAVRAEVLKEVAAKLRELAGSGPVYEPMMTRQDMRRLADEIERDEACS